MSTKKEYRDISLLKRIEEEKKSSSFKHSGVHSEWANSFSDSIGKITVGKEIIYKRKGD